MTQATTQKERTVPDVVEGQFMIVRGVKIDPTLTPQQVVDATNRTQFINLAILATMPESVGPDEDDVYFFPLKRWSTAEEVEKELELRNLIHNPRKQTQVNIDDPAFADKHSNGTQWNREGEMHNSLTFDNWKDAGRVVYCDRDTIGWDDNWWISGIVKPLSSWE